MLTDGQVAQIKAMKKDNSDLQIRKFFKETYNVKLGVKDIRNACKEEDMDPIDEKPAKVERRKYNRRKLTSAAVSDTDEVKELILKAYKMHKLRFITLVQSILEGV